MKYGLTLFFFLFFACETTMEEPKAPKLTMKTSYEIQKNKLSYIPVIFEDEDSSKGHTLEIKLRDSNIDVVKPTEVISGNSIQITPKPDFEGHSSLFIKITDPNDLKDSVEIEINVIDKVSREFWVNDLTKEQGKTDTYYKEMAFLQYENDKVQIYVSENKMSKVSETIAEKIGKEFTSTVYPKVTSIYGEPSDINSDGRVVILYYDIKDYWKKEGDPYVGGYFWGGDMNSDKYAQSQGYRSNEMEIFYMDCEQVKDITTVNAKSTLAHEFQHMISFNQRAVKRVQNNQAQLPFLPLWLSEALAEQASFETYGYEGIFDRFVLLGNDGSYEEGHSLVHWDGSDGRRIESYSYAALYMNWITEKEASSNHKTFLWNTQMEKKGTTAGFADQLSKFSGNSESKFTSSFVDWSVNGLLKAEGYNGLDEFNNRVQEQSPFKGIQLNTKSTGAYRPYSPVFLKYNSGKSVSVSDGYNKLVDASDSSLSQKTSLTVNNLPDKNYGVTLVFFPDLSDENKKNYSLPSSSISRSKVAKPRLNKSYQTILSLPAVGFHQ